MTSLPEPPSLPSGKDVDSKTYSRALRGYTLLFPPLHLPSPLPPASRFSSSRHLVSISDEITDVSAASTTIPFLNPLYSCYAALLISRQS